MNRSLRVAVTILALALPGMNTARADDDDAAKVVEARKATAEAPACRVTVVRTVTEGNKVEKIVLEIVRPDAMRALIEAKDGKTEIVTDGKKTVVRRGNGKFALAPAAREQIETLRARVTLAEVEYTGVEWVGHDHLDDNGAVMFRAVKKEGGREGEIQFWVADHDPRLLKVEESVNEGGKPIQHTSITYAYDPDLKVTMPSE